MAGPIDRSVPHDAERMKFFTDAVVAIAMTLLILPLLEAVAEAASEDLTTAEFLRENAEPLFSFVLSFVIIAGFWLGHERLFSLVGAWTSPLMMLNIAWMLTIVFLPVATAMTGSLTTDRAQILVYIGTMWLNSLLMLGMNVVVRRTPAVWEDAAPGTGGVAASTSLVVLFALALVIALLLPEGSHYFAMFVLFLTGPLQGLLNRRLRA